MKGRIFTGSGVALITPFQADGSVSLERLRELVEWQISQKTDAIIVCGTTGEASTLTKDEQAAVIAAAVSQARGRVPVIAGTGSNDTKQAIEKSKAAQSLGVDALLLVTPHYNKATQKGLLLHYRAIADAVDRPIILYNVPSRTGVCIAAETYQALSLHKNIVAIKEASGDFSAIMKQRELCGNALDLYSGNDDQILPVLSVGGCGVISVLANILPEQVHELCASYLRGDTEKSELMQTGLNELIRALFCEVNPIPVKTAMNLCGMGVGPLRLPLCGLSEEHETRLQQVLKKYGLLGRNGDGIDFGRMRWPHGAADGKGRC